jgi:tetratricopeptide (TPR) repeat protein
MMARHPRPALGTRLLARWHYAWGLSLCLAGHRLAERSYYAAGVTAFTRALQAWPTFAPAYYRLGLIRGRELGEYAAAIADLVQAGALQPEWPEPYLQRGLFHRFNQQPAAALIDLRRYTELAPPGFWRDEAARQIALITHEDTLE